MDLDVELRDGCGCAQYGINVVGPPLGPLGRPAPSLPPPSETSAACCHLHHHPPPSAPPASIANGVHDQHLPATGVQHHHVHATCHPWLLCFRDIGCEAINDNDCGGNGGSGGAVACHDAAVCCKDEAMAMVGACGQRLS